MRRVAGVAVLAVTVIFAAHPGRISDQDARLKGAFRRTEQNGWIYVHLQGTPAQIGFQHGYLLAPEIEDLLKVTREVLTHENHKNWAFFRDAAQNVFLPKVEAQYRDEMQGIVEGLNARGVSMDLTDVTVLNASIEMTPYYVDWYDAQHGIHHKRKPTPEHCSAFVATGSYTKDGRIAIAHNNWSEYNDGERWNIMFDIAPAAGHHILMDGLPGVIDSADDFGENDAGIVITETTIGYFSAFDPNGIPEFVRARKAMQYATSIDEFASIMKEGNNGAYANTWLVADINRNEIGHLELGLKNVTFDKKNDGYFVGSNFPENPELMKEEAPDFPANDMSISSNARHVRWKQLMEENKGKIDIAMAQKFLADHYDSFEHRDDAPSERTLDGHIDLSARGSEPWEPPYGIAGAVQNKTTDADMASKMELSAAMGHACGLNFNAAEHLRKHPQFRWEKNILRNMNSYPWTTFAATK
ncbi:MAG TPA: C45 family peptidase [Bryobacteraceae bacterium]|nr:C45 family peptidase [Bryobacteraceae bacterium]